MEFLSYSVKPGFGPAAEVLLFRQKDPKPLTPSLARVKRMDARWKTGQLALLKHARERRRASIRRASQQASENEESSTRKTWVGKAEQGFDFLGYHLHREGVTVAFATVERSVTRLRRLYEQEWGRPAWPSPLGVYVSRWWRWAEGGLPELGPLTSSLRPPIASQAQ